ncbi:MAG: hypothetical protein JXR03_20135, partial [Cyclobacteriaceae bacterium]
KKKRLEIKSVHQNLTTMYLSGVAYVVFPKNIGSYLTIDETSLSQGELYTVITNKAAKGNKGCLVAIIKGTDSERVKSILQRNIA